MTISIAYAEPGYWSKDYALMDNVDANLADLNYLNNSSASLILMIDGHQTNATDVSDNLPRAVLISLFTWRRANPDDDLPATNKYGWWGDTYAAEFNDRIGSRLWLLSRSKLTNETQLKAQEYATEALQWLTDDGVADSVQITAERESMNTLALQIIITRGDNSALNIRFINVWDYINAI